MGRNACGHTDRNTGGSVTEQVRHLRRKNDRFLACFIKVGLEVDRVLIEVLQHFRGEGGHLRFRVPHGSRRISIDRSKITL